jgi:hypothetical protein
MHACATIMWLTPKWAASLRVLQWVEPSRGLRFTLHSRMRASSAGVSVVGNCPPWRLNGAARCSAANRLPQRSMKLSVQSSFSRIEAQV